MANSTFDDVEILGGLMNASTLGTAGRIVFGIPFLVFGLMHFMKAGDMAGMVPSSVPGGIFWVYLTGVALVAAAVAMFTRILIVPAGLSLALLLIVFILAVHVPMAAGGEMQQAMPSILKDFALAGGALVAAAHAALTS